MLTKAQKEEVTKNFKRHESDTGSPEYQIALFTARINRLTAHLKENKHDFHSRRGLLKLVAKRKKAIKYLIENNPESYNKIAKELGLKSK